MNALLERRPETPGCTCSQQREPERSSLSALLNHKSRIARQTDSLDTVSNGDMCGGFAEFTREGPLVTLRAGFQTINIFGEMA